MALATVSIVEKNGAGGTETTATNCNFGSTDAANIATPANSPITAGTNSYEKWHYFKVTAMNQSTSVKNFKVWVSAALTGSDLIKTSAHMTQGTYDSSKRTSQGTDQYSQPVATASSYAINTPSYGGSGSPPATANIGVGGTLTGELTATGTSDYAVWQVQVNAASTTGQSVTIYYQYDEVN